jgi:hypothetical protein
MRQSIAKLALVAVLGALLVPGCEAAEEGDATKDIKFGSGLPDGFGSGNGGKDSSIEPLVDVAVNDASKPTADTIPDAETPDATAEVDTGGGGTGEKDIDVGTGEPDVDCEPQCDGKVCGPDGCGNICGFCTTGKACTEDGTECKQICDPVTPCKGKVCGPDGCGGVCGDCEANFACGDDGQCYPSDCEPLCEGKNCGPDKCGGLCGICPGTKLCDVDIGQCVDNPCDDIGPTGACKDYYVLLECTDSQIVETDCRDENPLYGCTWIKNHQKYGCEKPPECKPDCAGKQCGTDGCGGTCGSGCFEGWTCEGFQCTPQVGGACGTLTGVGKCINNKNYFCTGGSVYVEDCEALGKKCGYDGAQAVCKQK